ncbi:MAG: CCA tRNA nucleotidyltransferase [bacterium]|nr:CCA tRNA nucleotidyltransferase [bacterium]
MKLILKKIRSLAVSNRIKAYAVGGTVRDILLGKNEFDIDIAVEGDGIAFGRQLQTALGGTFRSHPKFGTSSLILDDLVIDIATCREEEYLAPAKLPCVKSTTLIDDLRRRDFTINSIAMRLFDSKLIDPFEGVKDLEAGIIRILHPNSFVDDPTRLFRALRFVGRFGFKLEPKTALLAKEAVNAGLINKLSPKRITRELVLILSEPARLKILSLLHKFGISKILHLNLPRPTLFKDIESNLKICISLNEPVTVWFVYLLGIIDIKNPSPFLCLTKKELNKIRRVCTILGNLQKLKSARLPSEIYTFLYGSSADELLFVMSAVPLLKPKLIKFLQIYKKVKLQITGRDLNWLGLKAGPLYKELLSAALLAKLDGKIKTKNDELKFVKAYSYTKMTKIRMANDEKSVK